MSEYNNYDDYVDENEENEYDAVRGKKITVGKVLKYFFKYIFITIGVLVCGLLFFRIFLTGEPDLSKEYIWNKNAVLAYKANPKEYKVYRVVHPDNISRDGNFLVSSVYFVPSDDQIQFTVRYNDSSLDDLVKEYKLKEKPASDPYVFTLSDQKGNFYDKYELITFKKGKYNYTRVIFDGVDMDALTVKDAPAGADKDTLNKVQKEKNKVKLMLNVHYKNEVYLSEPFSTLCVYDYSHYHEPFDINKYMFKDDKPTEGLKKSISYTAKEKDK